MHNPVGSFQSRQFKTVGVKGMVYLNRLPTEMRVLSMRDAAVRDRAITHTPEFVQFGIEHAEVLQ